MNHAVIAFEPALLQHTIFSVNIALNALQEKIDLHKVAISGTTGVSRLLTPLPDNIGRAYLNKYSQGEFVQLYPADYFLGDEYNISFIKIDVEGHEIDVLQGLESTIKRCSPTIFIEVDNTNAQRFYDWLSELGYIIVDRFKRYESNENFVIQHKSEP